MSLRTRNALCSVAPPSARADLNQLCGTIDPSIGMLEAPPLESAVLRGSRSSSSYRLPRPVVLALATGALAGTLVAAGQWIHPQPSASEHVAAFATTTLPG